MAVYSHGRLRSEFRKFLRLGVCLAGICWLFNLFLHYPNIIGLGTHQVPPRVGKVTMVYGNNSIYERAINTHKVHSYRLNYPHFILRSPILDGVWNKYAILLRVLLQELEKPPERRLEWLFWADADTVLMNPKLPLETFLPPSDVLDVHMLLTKDWNGMNNGVFPIRVHPWSVELLSAAIAYPVMNPDVELFWPDQSALGNILEENDYFAKSVVYCPLRWFNAYMGLPDGEGLNPKSPEHLQVHRGDLLVHFPGTPRDSLEETLGPYLAIAEAHRGDWELPLESTGYVREIEEFWEQYR